MIPSIVRLYFLLFFMTRIVHGNSNCSCEIDLKFAEGVSLLYYKCNKMRDTIAYPIAKPEKLLKELDPKKQTIFYIFGFTQFPQKPNVELLTDALCCGKTDNIVIVDWSKYSNGSLMQYPQIFTNAEKVGSLFARSIRLLVNRGLNKSKIYIIGNSLGAHIAGFAGKCNDFKIPRITGLDPANSRFYPAGCYLTRNDAAWIDVIHTDMGGYGTTEYVGTVDFLVNCGIRTQPGCPTNTTFGSDDDFCSHQKASELYANSKYHPNLRFPVTKCGSDLSCAFSGKNVTCPKYGFQRMYVGYKTDYRRGVFYLSSNFPNLTKYHCTIMHNKVAPFI